MERFPILHNFRAPTAHIVIRISEVPGIPPVQVDSAVVLVSVQGALAETQYIISVHNHRSNCMIQSLPVLNSESLGGGLWRHPALKTIRSGSR